MTIIKTYPVYMTLTELQALHEVLGAYIVQLDDTKDAHITDRATFSTPEQLLEFLGDLDIDRARLQDIQIRVENALERSTK